MAWGLTSYGFEKPSYDEWLNLYKTHFKSKYGLSQDLATSSLVSDFLSVFAYQDIRIWESMEAVYNSQTLNGAEGIFLDEVLGRRGVFREGAKASSGIAIIKTLKTAPWTTAIPTSAVFTGNTETIYKPDSETQIRDRIYAMIIPLADFGASTSVTFNIVNSTDNSNSSVTLNPQSGSFLTSLESFVKINGFVTDNDKIFINGSTLYIGFALTDLENPIGVVSATQFYSNFKFGTKWSGIPVTAITKGFSPVAIGGMTTVTPASYISGSTLVSVQQVTNFSEFFSGSDTETDTEYRVKFNTTVDEALASTAPAIRSALLKLDGVTKVRIYDNPTVVSEDSAPALTFQTVILGGSTDEIAQTLYNTKPINTLAFGTVDTVIDTEDGGTEVVGFTPATQSNINIKIEYTPSNNKPLSPSEITSIKTNLINLAANFLIGTTVFNAQLQSAIFSGTNYGRFSNLAVLVKKIADSDELYTSDDYSTVFNEIVLLNDSDILFEHVV